MANWISLLEKYRVDRRLLDLRLHELAALSPHSPKRPALLSSVQCVEQDLHAAERALARYGDASTTPRDALHRADERLFLAYRYLCGLTMEKTALAMCISRDSVYRIRRRVVARGEIPAEYLEEEATLPSTAACDIPLPVEPRANVLAACFAGAPDGIPHTLYGADF